MGIIRKLPIVTILFVLWGASWASLAGVNRFDGITIIKLPRPELAEYEERHGPSGGAYLVLFVSKYGTYATILKPGQKQECVAWMEDQSSVTNDSITFGLPRTKLTQELVYPPICERFSLSHIDKNRVRVQLIEPLRNRSPQNHFFQTFATATELNIIAHIPLAPIDWDMTAFSTHTINDIPLGPLPSPQGKLLEWGRLQQSPDGTTSGSFKLAGSGESGKSVYGTSVSTDKSRLPQNVLYAAKTGKRLKKPTLSSVFEEVILDRYGQASLTGGNVVEYQKEYYWLFDMQGELSLPDKFGRDNCSSMFEFWHRDGYLSTYDKDIGPWGCALVLRLVRDGRMQPTVREYSIDAVSGYVLALLHFNRRIKEVSDMRKKLQEAQSYKPTL